MLISSLRVLVQWVTTMIRSRQNTKLAFDGYFREMYGRSLLLRGTNVQHTSAPTTGVVGWQCAKVRRCIRHTRTSFYCSRQFGVDVLEYRY